MIRPMDELLLPLATPKSPEQKWGWTFATKRRGLGLVLLFLFLFFYFFLMEKMLMCQNKVSLRECASFGLTLFRNFWSKLRS